MTLFKYIALFIFLTTTNVYATSEDDLINIIKKFYSSLPNDCKLALQISPMYKDCKNTFEARVEYAYVEYREENSALVSLRISYQRGNKKKTENGYAEMTRLDDDEWTFEWWCTQGCGKDSSTKKENTRNKYTTNEELTLEPNIDYKSNYQNKISGQCWTNIRGTPGERKIRKLPKPDPGRMDSHLIEQAQLDPPQTDIPGSIRYVKISNGKKPIALTFDLCERADEVSGYDAEIVNYLRDNEIKATFYASGKWMKTHKERTKQLMAYHPLFEIGNHAWTHGNMRVLTGQRMRNQILWTQAQYYAIRKELNDMECVTESDKNTIPWVPATFRFPYGTCSSESLNTLNELGLAAIQWNIVTGDPARGQTAQGIANIVLKEAKPGAIIIAHANGRGHGTAQSLPLFIPKLQADGYKFVTVSELLRMGTPHAVSTCYELKPGDNVRYDKIFGKGTGE